MRKILLVLLILVTGAGASPVLRCELRGSENRPIQIGKNLHGGMHFLLFSEQDGLKVFQEWNSWGYYARSFVAVDLESKAKSYRIARHGGNWDKNAPTTHTLNRGEFLVTEIDLVDGTWSVTPKLPVRTYLRLSLTGEFQIAKDAEASAAGVWVGNIKSPPAEIMLDQPTIERLNKV